MAGIYLHIPFCRQACHYCNFHFSTSLKSKSDIVTALTKEIDQRHTYLNVKHLDTIYFGGGTPSVLDVDEIEVLLNQIRKFYVFDSTTEITLEANPEDLTDQYLREIKTIGINRLSIGIQSFFDEDLKFMNRSHNAKQAKLSLDYALQHFDDISIDLIFGGQYSSDSNWTENLMTAIDLDITHLSCYSLTIEEGTAFGSWINKNKLQSIESEVQKDQFIETMERLTKAGYEHYEISNYARSNKYARHNTNYWRSEPYLGIGPSAHSYNGQSRQWNVANNHKYLEGILQDQNYGNIETLTQQDKYNEYILTSLRTMWGSKQSKINQFDKEYIAHFKSKSKQLVSQGKTILKEDVLYLTKQGKLFADQVAEELFYLN